MAQFVTPDISSQVWGGEVVEYTRDNIGQGCSVKWTVIGGVFPDFGNQQVISTTNQKVNIKWNNTSSQSGYIKTRVKLCTNPSDDKSYTYNGYTILSINNVSMGTLQVNAPVGLCGTTARTFSIPEGTITYSNPVKKASGYEWTIPSGWTGPQGQTGTFFVDSPNAYSISLTPSLCPQGTEEVKVRAYTDTEGKGEPHYSKVSKLTITRAGQPVITTDEPVKCGIPFTASVTELSCATGYNWTVPSGWQISGSGSTRTITPNGLTGQISVDIPVQGGCVVSATKEVTASFDPKLNGPNLLCTSGTYTLSDVPVGASITWSVSPTSAATVSGSGASVTVTRNSSYNGQVALTAAVSASCGSVQREKNFWAGVASASNIIIWNSTESSYPYNTIPINTPVEFVAGYPPGNRCDILETQWDVSSSSSVMTGSFPCVIDNGTSKLIVFHTPGTAYVRARIRNACGWSQWSMAVPMEVTSSGGGWNYNVGPNPVNNQLNITELEKEEADRESISREAPQATAILYNRSGTPVRTQVFSGEGSIDVKGLLQGHYILKIIFGKEEETHHIIVN